MAEAMQKTDRADRFVGVVGQMLDDAKGMLPRAATDSVTANHLRELLETAANLVDDHVNPRPRYYVDVLSPPTPGE